MAKGTGSIGEIRKKVTKTLELISTSYHEAGHTIYALLHVMKVYSVSVFENKKLKRIHGSTYYNYPIEFGSIQNLELLELLARADIGLSYAGLIAEKILFKGISGSSQIPQFISAGSTDDNESAREMIKKYNLALPGKKRMSFKIKLMREVQNELYQHWDDVTLVSHALFQYRKLSYQDLQYLLTRKSKNKKFWKEQFKNINYFHNNEALDELDLKSILSR
jgi:hypothetical protein